VQLGLGTVDKIGGRLCLKQARPCKKAIERFKEWELGGGKFQGAGQPVDTLDKWREKSGLSFNLKHRDQKRYLQWEEQTLGVNLGYSDDATSDTAREKARWFFKRPSGSGPVRYGEAVAMGFGTHPSFYKYAQTRVGVNIENTGTPSYEWRFIGGPGTAGAPVRTGEWLAIYNDIEGDFLIYFNRDVGVDLGWPTSKTWLDQGIDWSKELVEEAIKDYIKAQAEK